MAQRDVTRAWQSLYDNSLAARADGYPEHAYGVWSGPSLYEGADRDGAGLASLVGPRPDADYPTASTEVHMSMVRASLALLGIRANPAGWRIDPKLPSESYSVVLPNLELRGTPSSIEGSITAQGEELMELVVTLPSGARGGDLVVRVKAAEVEFVLGTDDTVSFVVPVLDGEPVAWSVAGI